ASSRSRSGLALPCRRRPVPTRWRCLPLNARFGTQGDSPTGATGRGSAMDVEPELVVVKVGGSLYDLPDLGQRLAAWVHRLPASKVLLVPGGGATTDVVRDLDRCHGLGEATAHDLAMRSLTLNAWFLAAVLRETAIGSLSVCNPLLSPLTDRVSV